MVKLQRTKQYLKSSIKSLLCLRVESFKLFNKKGRLSLKPWFKFSHWNFLYVNNQPSKACVVDFMRGTSLLQSSFEMLIALLYKVNLLEGEHLVRWTFFIRRLSILTSMANMKYSQFFFWFFDSELKNRIFLLFENTKKLPKIKRKTKYI